MKSILTFFFIVLGYFTSQAQFNFGVGTSMVFSSSDVAVQGKAIYSQNNLAFSGTYNYFFTHSVGSVIDLDAHYKLVNGDNFELRPMVGLNIKKGVGLNVGVFSVIRLDKVNLYVEPKLIIDSSSFLAISAGLYF